MIARIALALAILSVIALAAPAKEENSSAPKYRLQWRDLNRIVRGRPIHLTLPSGVKLRANVVSVDPEGLVLDITKTSNRQAYPKGRAVIPRADVAGFRLVQKKSFTWRAVGAGVGGAIGAALAIPLSAYLLNEGGDIAGPVALMVGIPAGLGYLLGWAADGKVIDIVVEPGPSASTPCPGDPVACQGSGQRQ